MESKDRVIVIDLVGDSEEAAVKAGKASDHECRCGVCNCDGKYEGAQLELQLQSYEFPAPGADSGVRRMPSGAALQPRRGARKPSIR